MIGTVSVKVGDSRSSYSFELKRNITILMGNSGSGKTTLFEMIFDYNRYGKNHGIKLVCDKPVIAVNRDNWEETIEKTSNAVIVIDEDNNFIRTKEFATIVQGSSNYYLLITRVELEQLPISVEEIYEIVGSKNKKFKKVYTNTSYMYNAPSKSVLPFKPELIITEDSKTGFQFFSAIATKNNIECIPADGKSNIYKLLVENKDKGVVVIADGAAFGTQIRNIVERQQLFPRKIAIFLPESFEWLILKAGIANDPDWDVLVSPEKYIDSGKYFSWERFFTEMLVQVTKEDKYKKYPKNKGKLPEYYIQDRVITQVKNIISGINFE